MSEAKVIEVSCCAVCPHFYAATVACRDAGKKLSRTPFMRPPRWCPLRRTDHLVTLRVK